jgi:hypothetical protein
VVEETETAGKKDMSESLETASHQKADSETNSAKDLLGGSPKFSSEQNTDSTGLVSEEAPEFGPNSLQSSENMVDPCYNTTTNQTPRKATPEEDKGSLRSEDENSSVDEREEDSAILETEVKDLLLNSDSLDAAMDDSELSCEDATALELSTLKLTEPEILASIEESVGGMSPPRSRSPNGKQLQVTDKIHSMVLLEYIIPDFMLGEDLGQDDSFIYFQDYFLRKFRLSFKLVKSWEVREIQKIIHIHCLIAVKGMCKFITRSFEHEETSGTHVKQGHYYMKTPSGDIIIPLAWEDTIQPDWFIIMQLWTGFYLYAGTVPSAPDYALLYPPRPLQVPPEHIIFQDAVSCRYAFPFDLVTKWTVSNLVIIVVAD